MVRLLINGGADINPLSWLGWTPYDYADEWNDKDHGERKHTHSEILALLRENGGLKSDEDVKIAHVNTLDSKFSDTFL